MNNETSFRSYAQNQEDVSLWRGLNRVTNGHYVEVGAHHPTIKSTSYAFYLRGWSGLLVEPQGEYCELSRLIRPRDTVFQTAIGDCNTGSTKFYRTPGGTRSTLQSSIAKQYAAYTEDHVPCTTLDSLLETQTWSRTDFNFLILDVEGSEARALQGLNLSTYRPWIIVIESIDPVTKEDVSERWRHLITNRGYTFSHFDGVSQFYVADEHRNLLNSIYPACSTDDYKIDFPQLSSDQSRQLSASSNKLSKTTNAVLSDLISMTAVSGGSAADSLASQMVDLLKDASTERIEQIEQVAAILQVVSSRARLQKSVDETNRIGKSDIPSR